MRHFLDFKTKIMFYNSYILHRLIMVLFSPQVDLRRGISASVFSTSPCKVNEQKFVSLWRFPERFAREIRPTQSLIANVFSMEFSN